VTTGDLHIDRRGRGAREKGSKGRSDTRGLLVGESPGKGKGIWIGDVLDEAQGNVTCVPREWIKTEVRLICLELHYEGGRGARETQREGGSEEIIKVAVGARKRKRKKGDRLTGFVRNARWGGKKRKQSKETQ